MKTLKVWLESAWVQAVTTALVLASIVAGTLFQIEASRRERCVERWADATSTRTQLITTASTRRSDALDNLLLVAGRQDQAANIVAYQRYVEASEEYRQAIVDHPPPAPPKLHC